MGDTDLIQPSLPRGEHGAVRASEPDVVESRSELRLADAVRIVLVQSEPGVVQGEDRVMEAAFCEFVQQEIGSDEALVPGPAQGQVGRGDGDVADAREVAPVRLRLS